MIKKDEKREYGEEMKTDSLKWESVYSSIEQGICDIRVRNDIYIQWVHSIKWGYVKNGKPNNSDIVSNELKWSLKNVKCYFCGEQLELSHLGGNVFGVMR